MKPALVSLAAGASQLPLILAARRRGFEVIGVDRDKRAVGLVECAAHIAASTHDPEEVLDGLHRLEGFKLEGVVARSSGPPVLTAALVAHQLGLAGLRPDAAHAAVSKSGQKELARNAGLRVPDARSAAPGAVFETPGSPPWVVKPRVTRVGKAAVRLVERSERLAAAVREAAEVSEDGCVEIEAWAPGRDVVIAGGFQASSWFTSAIFEEDTAFHHLGPVNESRRLRALDEPDVGAAIGWGLATPAALPSEVERQLVDAARSFVLANDLGDGVAFFTFRVEADRTPTFLEAHLDLGGDYVVDALLAECGLNELAVDLATRRPVAPPAPARGARVLRFLFASDPGERLGALTQASPTARVVLDRPGGVGPFSRVGYFIEDTTGPDENLRWAAEVQELLQR